MGHRQPAIIGQRSKFRSNVELVTSGVTSNGAARHNLYQVVPLAEQRPGTVRPDRVGAIVEVAANNTVSHLESARATASTVVNTTPMTNIVAIGIGGVGGDGRVDDLRRTYV